MKLRLIRTLSYLFIFILLFMQMNKYLYIALRWLRVINKHHFIIDLLLHLIHLSLSLYRLSFLILLCI